MNARDAALERARLALNRGNIDVALRGCAAILGANPRDAAARHLRGLCLAASGKLKEATHEFVEALAIQPSYLPARADLGVALAALGRHAEAEQHIGAALARDGRPAELHYALGQCRFAAGELRGAVESFAAAVSRRPDLADAHNNLGVALDRLGDTDRAIRSLERARTLQPGMVAAHRNLADVLRRRQRHGEALEALERAVALLPRDADLLCELAETLFDAGRMQDATTIAQSAITLAPDSARAHAAAGMALLSGDRCAEAAPLLEEALRLDPACAHAAVNLGEGLLRLERPGAAAEAFQRALEVAELPEARLGLGRALAGVGDAEAAARNFAGAHQAKTGDVAIATRAALELERLGCLDKAAVVLEGAAANAPEDPRVHHALGAFLHRRGRLAEALDCYECALQLDANQGRVWLDRGHALESTGKVSAAIASYQAALALNARSPEALGGLVSCAFRLCDWAALDAYLPVLQALPDGIDALHPFLVLALDMSAQQQWSALRRRAPSTSTSAVVRPPRSCRPLRVAYVSPDFRDHPVAHALVAVIESHDPARVQAIGVYLSTADHSAVAGRLRSAFDMVLDASAMTDQQVITRMRELEVDVAVDLAGYTTGARPGLFAARCAPVQVNYLGFSATMGTRCIDYIIADDVVIPKSEDNAYSERVLRLPRCYLPLDDTRCVASGALDRVTAGLPEHGFVFCAFNSSYKINRETFHLWMSLLRDVPHSVLWLRRVAAATAEQLATAAAQLGVAPSRLIFAPHVERVEDYLARLRLADLFLDTSPYNAHTTAADALWAGLPVLTCPGRSFAARVGASLLTAAELPELVCSDLAQYRAKALRLASQPGELNALRERLGHLRESGVFEALRYTRNLEALYESIAPVTTNSG
jgi:predicted O-linked N-acetylglucosamine transferase (SPINDLY family)